MRLLVVVAALAGVAHADPPDYPKARAMCNEHVSGTGLHITWRSVATTDSVAKVVEFYEKATKKKATTGQHGSRRISLDDSTDVVIFRDADQAKFPSCTVKAKAGETVIMVSKATHGK